MDHIAIINWSESVLNARKRATKALGSDRQKIPAPAAIKNSRLQAASAPQHCLIVNNI